jgi:hypothetical protein
MSKKHQEHEGESSNSFTKEEVQSLARKLEEWGQGLPPGERELLEFLVARAESLSTEEKEELIVIDKKIREAAYSALEAFINSKKQKKETCILWRRTSAATR